MTTRRDHEWGVVAQDYDREGALGDVMYCPLCNKWQATGRAGYIKKSDIPQTAFAVDSGQPFWGSGYDKQRPRARAR